MENFNILIVGAGVAGLSCANLMKQRGLKATIIEKTPLEDFHDGGYMLGISPPGGRFLTELGLKEKYFKLSTEMNHYKLHKQNGDLLKSLSLKFISEKYFSYRGIERKHLIELLLSGIGKENIRFDTTVKKISQNKDGVSVFFSDGKKEIFDIVVGADGMHSQTRKNLWSKDEYCFYETHWGCWISWLDHEKFDKSDLNTYKEYWGTSCFFGLYPAKDRMCILIGGPNSLTEKIGLKDFAKKIKKELKPKYKKINHIMDMLSDIEAPYYWKLHDCRTKTWRKGNVVLLGDAAAGFLPTAGVGASMSMDSAAALVDELCRSDKKHIPYALDLYIKRQKDRVEKAQQDSRDLGKIMFIKSALKASIRDYFIKFYPPKKMAEEIGKIIGAK